MPTKAITLPGVMEQFGCEDRCRDLLEELRWPEGVHCPRCNSDKISRIKKRHQFDCDSCRYQFSVRVGTIFHDSKLPLSKWFLAVYLIIESKKGVSANQLKRMLGISYKTAWFLCHRIRASIKDENAPLLSGEVEIDETWIGGRARGREMRVSNKTLVMAAIQRGGELRMKVVPNAGKRTFHKFVREHTKDETEVYYTDEHSSYKGIADHNTRHETVTHHKKQWVVGKAHTQTAESVFSLLKRSILGSYHMVSEKHLPAYLDEMEWRFNNRENPYLFRDTILELISAERLEYKELTA